VLAYSPVLDFSGSLAQTTDAVAFEIPDRTVVDFKTLSNHGTCAAVLARRLKPDNSLIACVGNAAQSTTANSLADCNPTGNLHHVQLVRLWALPDRVQLQQLVQHQSSLLGRHRLCELAAVCDVVLALQRRWLDLGVASVVQGAAPLRNPLVLYPRIQHGGTEITEVARRF
jgi:hypothetical protein